jgi:hypothetical protein
MSGPIIDGSHQRFVDVVPLQPPFQGKVRTFHFSDRPSLAVSEDDGKAIIALMGGKDRGPHLIIEDAGYGGRVRVRVEHT